MGRRYLFCLFSLLLAFTLLAGVYALPARGKGATGGGLIINEWSQGHGDRKEWVELLVTAGPADLRGWDLGDNSPGDLAFTEHALWEAVPAGTLIVIYNATDPDLLLPPDDADARDGVLVLPHASPLYFDGGWPAFANTTADDNPHVRNRSGQTIHDFTQAPGSSRHPEAEECTFYLGEGEMDVAGEAWWANDAPATAATPGAGNNLANRRWIDLLRGVPPPILPDLSLDKQGPLTATAGSTITYRLHLENAGLLTATGVILTDVLPAGLAFAGENSALPFSRPAPDTLVWEVGTVPPTLTATWFVSAGIESDLYGLVTNTARVTTSVTESEQLNNHARAATRVESAGGRAPVLVDAVLYDGYEYLDADEAVRLRATGSRTLDLSGWRLTDGNTGAGDLPPGTTLAPAATLWLAKDGDAFRRQFGFAPDVILESWPGFANSGDEVLLEREDGVVVDAVVYKAGIGEAAWWQGPPLFPYTVPNILPEEGQVLYRRLDQVSGRPVPDSDREADWAQTRQDPIDGRRVQYPGWSLAPFFFTGRVTQTAGLTVAIAPDHAYAALVAELVRARESVSLETLTFEHVGLADALVAAAGRGVAVTVLLEGDPVAGVADAERYVCQQLERAGGACWFMIRDDGQNIQDRYRYLHAKFMLIDGRRVIVSSENMSPNSLPADDKTDGTWGRRGVLLMTDAPAVVTRFQQIFADDFAPADHQDLLRWQAAHPVYGAPPSGFVPVTATGGTTYTVRFGQPIVVTGTFAFEVLQAPENSLRDRDGLLGLLGRAGAGDTVLVEQLSERPHWGPTGSDPESDPNPRLEAYLDAARRGARVRLLLDSYFDDAGSSVSNRATCEYVKQVALHEHLRITCALGNPAGLGIHNKMVLAEIDGQGWVHVGSLNGTEQAAKGNREVALQVRSDAVYALLAGMFAGDWPNHLRLPVLYRDYRGPATYPLISEVLYDPLGLDAAEFIELVNPTPRPVDLSGWLLGDAVDPDDFEDMRRFPADTVLPSQSTLVIAFSATSFYEVHSRYPDFEIYPSTPFVPDLVDEPGWGDPAAWLQLGNGGDEVILRDGAGQVVDVLAYGAGAYPGIVSAPLVGAANHSLERYPYWLDTDNCVADFREWPLPDPGGLPAR